VSTTDKPNNEARLRELLLQIYVSGCLMPENASPEEHERLLDIALAAGEGRPFPDLGLPYPRSS
jgi:hypothetical protein